MLRRLFFAAILCGLMLSPTYGAGEKRAHGFTQEEMLQAYDAFHARLFDPVRKIYWRDSGGGDKVGAIWTQAIYWDMAMNAWQKSGQERYRKRFEDIYEGNYRYYDRFNWDNEQVWFIYDDIMWWVISLARAYQLTGAERYLEASESGFRRVWSGSSVVGDRGSYDSERGGMSWAWKNVGDPYVGKMACINYPTVIGAMCLYEATGDTTYYARAREIYTWARRNLFDPEGGQVADSKHGNGKPAWKSHLYNQATCIGAAVMLYEQTGDQTFLDDARRAADYVYGHMLQADEVLPFEDGEEQGVYHAIFAQYISMLGRQPGCDGYLEVIRQNIRLGWGNRNRRSDLTDKDFRVPTPPGPVRCYDASGIPAYMLAYPEPEGQE